MAEDEWDPRHAHRLVRDELLVEGNARLNLATFCQTWVEPEVVALLAETYDKNMIDKDEYPQTAEIERRCVNIIGGLWNAPAAIDADPTTLPVGTSTTGSSEACMLGRHGAEAALAGAQDGRRRAGRSARTSSWAPTCRSAGTSSPATGTSSSGSCRSRASATRWTPRRR